MRLRGLQQKSALEQFATKQSQITFLSDDHIELECDPDVQNWVGPLVSATSSPAMRTKR